MWISTFLTIVGLTLIGLEFFLPGGLIALIGGLLVIGAVANAFALDLALIYKIGFLFANIVATVVTCKLAMWAIRSKNKDSLYLDENQEGFVASSFEKSLIGLEAIAHSDLKPSGHIAVGEEHHQAVSEGEYISKGTRLTISGGRGAYLIVKEKI